MLPGVKLMLLPKNWLKKVSWCVEDIKEIDDYQKLKEIKNAIKVYDSLEELTDNIDLAKGRERFDA